MSFYSFFQISCNIKFGRLVICDSILAVIVVVRALEVSKKSPALKDILRSSGVKVDCDRNGLNLITRNKDIYSLKYRFIRFKYFGADSDKLKNIKIYNIYIEPSIK